MYSIDYYYKGDKLISGLLINDLANFLESMNILNPVSDLYITSFSNITLYDYGDMEVVVTCLGENNV